MIDLAPASFSYGRAINIAMEIAKSEVVAIISAHVVLQATTLACLVAACASRDVAGAYGRLLPGKDLNPFEARNIGAHYGTMPRVQWSDTRFTNSLSAIKREVWARERFDEEIPAAEDREWVSRVQGHGYSVVYVPAARAMYLQDFGIWGIYGRAKKLGYAHQMMRPSTRPRFAGCIASAAGWTALDFKAWVRRELPLRWLFAAPIFRLRQEVGLYVGAYSAFRHLKQTEDQRGYLG
jgi:hypothetical protein